MASLKGIFGREQRMHEKWQARSDVRVPKVKRVKLDLFDDAWIKDWMQWKGESIGFPPSPIEDARNKWLVRGWCWGGLGTVWVHFTGEPEPTPIIIRRKEQPYEGARVLGELMGKGFIPVGGIKWR